MRTSWKIRSRPKTVFLEIKGFKGSLCFMIYCVVLFCSCSLSRSFIGYLLSRESIVFLLFITWFGYIPIKVPLCIFHLAGDFSKLSRLSCCCLAQLSLTLSLIQKPIISLRCLRFPVLPKSSSQTFIYSPAIASSI